MTFDQIHKNFVEKTKQKEEKKVFLKKKNYQTSFGLAITKPLAFPNKVDFGRIVLSAPLGSPNLVRHTMLQSIVY